MKPAPIVISLDLMETVAHTNHARIEAPEGEGWSVMVLRGLTFWAWTKAPGQVAS